MTRDHVEMVILKLTQGFYDRKLGLKTSQPKLGSRILLVREAVRCGFSQEELVLHFGIKPSTAKQYYYRFRDVSRVN